MTAPGVHIGKMFTHGKTRCVSVRGPDGLKRPRLPYGLTDTQAEAWLADAIGRIYALAPATDARVIANGICGGPGRRGWLELVLLACAINGISRKRAEGDPAPIGYGQEAPGGKAGTGDGFFWRGRWRDDADANAHRSDEAVGVGVAANVGLLTIAKRTQQSPPRTQQSPPAHNPGYVDYQDACGFGAIKKALRTHAVDGVGVGVLAALRPHLANVIVAARTLDVKRREPA